ncbi:MAG: adenylosuccinate lyase [Patescibacteria group bacterium]
MSTLNSLQTISPLDGRYANQIGKLAGYFCEGALMKYRVLVEVEYLLALGREPQIKEVKRYNSQETKKIVNLYIKFCLADAERIKEIEKTTNHDVKAVEYFIKEKLTALKITKNLEFVHFGLTSEDVNNLAYTLMLRNGVEKEIIPAIEDILKVIKRLAQANRGVALLALTHGQPATPTTLGKEMAVFYSRLSRSLDQLRAIKLEGKLNGAVGNYAAANLVYPQVDWLKFSERFIKLLGFNPNLLTTQIESHDVSAMMYDAIARTNNIVKDLDQDMWLYISRGVFKLHKKAGEVGSSTMPHKVNPINFENSEGNLGLANSLLRFMADKLPVSRLQRDLTDSTVSRNQGVALAYSLVAYQNTLTGLEKLEVDTKSIRVELDNHWEVLAEAVQTTLRKLGYQKPYEKLKELTRGEKVTKEIMCQFIKGLEIDKKEKEKLLELTPETYIGLSVELVKRLVK